MTSDWGWRRRWRLYAGCLAAVVAVLATVLLLPSGGRHEALTTDDPTATPTVVEASPSTTSSSTPSTAPDATPTSDSSLSPEPTATVTATASSARAVPHLDQEHLLSEPYVSRAFGSDRRPFVGDGGTDAASACRPLVTSSVTSTRIVVARIWSWPGEVVVGETFARAATADDASEDLRLCRSAHHEWGHEGSPEPLDLGDESFLWRSEIPLAGEAMAGIRVGRDLLFLTWRRTGGIGSTAALASAAEDALARSREEPVGTPEVAAPRAVSDALRGFVGYEDLRPLMNPEDRGWDAMSWWQDLDLQRAFSCNDDYEHRLAPAGPVVTRSLRGGVLNAMDYVGVDLSLAIESDEATAVQQMAACRQASASSAPVADLGDEAFEAATGWTLDGTEHSVFVRVGRRYVVLAAYNEQHWVEMARAAVASLQAAGRLG